MIHYLEFQSLNRFPEDVGLVLAYFFSEAVLKKNLRHIKTMKVRLWRGGALLSRAKTT